MEENTTQRSKEKKNIDGAYSHRAEKLYVKVLSHLRRFLEEKTLIYGGKSEKKLFWGQSRDRH